MVSERSFRDVGVGKNHESVVIGDSSHLDQILKVTVLDVRGDKVRLGFEADKSVPVNRWEVWKRIHGSRCRRSGDHAENNSTRDVPAAC
ncbi:MAG TPA: carbon storage regulator [Lacipirellulaceae bacterium]